MTKEDSQIISALYHGYHLNKSELERASVLLFALNMSFKQRHTTNK